MPSSGYTAWSVVADEQPTTAKWNIIGSNMASFNNGNGFEDSIILTRHLNAGAVTDVKMGANSIELASLRDPSGDFTLTNGAWVDLQDMSVGFTTNKTNQKVILLARGQLYGNTDTSPISLRFQIDGVTIGTAAGKVTPGATTTVGFVWFDFATVAATGAHTAKLQGNGGTGDRLIASEGDSILMVLASH